MIMSYFRNLNSIETQFELAIADVKKEAQYLQKEMKALMEQEVVLSVAKVTMDVSYKACMNSLTTKNMD